jgi:ABC-2 type transport system ATP-binding protein
VIRGLVADGATLLLTTQYLEEADQLADDIVVIDHGRSIAQGTPDQLKSSVGGERLELVVASDADIEPASAVLARHRSEADGGGAFTETETEADVEINPSTRTLQLAVDHGIDSLSAVLDDLRHDGIAVSDIGLRRPTLDDVFLTLTGHAAEVSESNEPVEVAS